MIVLRVLLDAVLLVVLCLTAVRLLGLDRGFPLAPLMTVFPYVVAIAGAVAVLALFGGWWVETATGLIAFLLGVGVVLPRVFPTEQPEVERPAELTVGVSNLRFGQGAAEDVVRAVDEYGIDVLVVLELTDRAIGRLEGAGIGERLPEQVLLASRLTSGGGIYSRYPLEARAPSRQRRFGATPKATIALPDGVAVEVDAVHPLPPTSEDWTRSWEEGLRQLPAPNATGDGQPIKILAGDFNATHDHRLFRELLAQGWVDAAASRGKALRSTFSALGFGEPVPPVTLDHVLVPSDVAVESVVVCPIPRSDHRMIVAELRLPRP